MKVYVLRKKNGKGARWFMNADQLFAGRYVKAFSADGFETILDLDQYEICE